MASFALRQAEPRKKQGHPFLLPFAAVALNLLALFNGLDAMAALTDSRSTPWYQPVPRSG